MIICINKPAGITSHDVVNKVRRVTGEKTVGHGGSLDPFATGVLVIGIGREGTKQLGSFLTHSEKEYIATLELGKTSDTGDSEGIVQESMGRSPFSVLQEEIKNVLATSFTGDILQIPPALSAIKIGGVSSYKLARQGKPVNLPPRRVNIREIEILDWTSPLLNLRVVCSSGTYIRSLAKDIGTALKTGAYLEALIRTRVGSFTLKDCVPISSLKSAQS
ncbi:MAG: tRNA pseudouridine(55) synthase TruB [bacterium]|nr:tRNA pseudouridine(55) synthase TruB [bacterium]